MSQSPIRAFVSEVGRLTANDRHAQSGASDQVGKLSATPQFDPSEILAHIDRKLADFVDVARGRKDESSYAVDVTIDFPDFKSTISISVGTNDSAQDIINSLWSVLSDRVKAFTYLESWILEDKATGAKMVAREILPLIPAKYLFRSEIEWVARPLSKPYSLDVNGFNAARPFGDMDWIR